ncbi:universal stress protein [Pseudorhodoplanes sinuspersici]|uniref:Universal stress protein UspA n=1 Tax=Pseudorhodoplanes sinuspersici TaxID=1235591 RepID=A0A1W6ZNA0_9HYPH|nr:universal stress protein [Pseudorhodoplanes sinuspersici]ARP98755.1 universal stress protein UspA [Pseudorhodoplanes sinuspersici]RKE69634.1 nucleotide-binding universal stress UspA family protein [Pseudorhodoplanes sinuspersici]
MLKRILVLLDETPSSATARDYALRLAHATGAEVAGLAGIDLSYIKVPMPGAVGAAAYKAKLEQELKTQADETLQRIRETFERECTEQNLPFTWLSFEGDPAEHLHLAAETRDIIVTGHDTAFHGDTRNELPEMLSNLLLATPRPVVLCPDERVNERDVLIAYDGSLPAMRAVQLFALLGLWRGSRIHVTSIDTDHALATRKAHHVVEYLQTHDYRAEAHPIGSNLHPSDVLRSQVIDRNIGTLVMGAYGRRGLQSFLFGSTTKSLVQTPPCPLFVYH